jgi:hypothetical protein
LTSLLSISLWNFSAILSASLFYWPHKLSSLYGFLSSWWAFAHQSWCWSIDALMQATISVTISTSLL